MRRAIEYWERPQQLADRCARGGALCTARRSPAIPYRSMAFFGHELPCSISITPSSLPNLSVKEAAMVKVSNILVERSSNAARELAKVGKLWIIENPVRRTIPMVHGNVLTLASSQITPHFGSIQ